LKKNSPEEKEEKSAGGHIHHPKVVHKN